MPFHHSMADIIELFRKRVCEDQQQDTEKREKAGKETAKAVDMQESSMETFDQIKKRKDEQEQKKCKRSTCTETVAYLIEKAIRFISCHYLKLLCNLFLLCNL